jgi:hypothetical protein
MCVTHAGEEEGGLANGKDGTDSMCVYVCVSVCIHTCLAAHDTDTNTHTHTHNKHTPAGEDGPTNATGGNDGLTLAPGSRPPFETPIPTSGTLFGFGGVGCAGAEAPNNKKTQSGAF